MTVAVTRSEIRAAGNRLTGYLRRTPILTVDGAELGTKGTVSMKLEFLQHSGTFKARGAANFMLAADVTDAGVAAASGGNHGAAVAWAAQQQGVRAHIFVPSISSPTKVARLSAYGADVAQVGSVYAESLAACNNFVAESGATSIHAYEDPLVMAGAGTTGMELETQTAPLDAVLVACGGGGLVGGVAAWFAGGKRPIRIVACETETTTAFASARAAGQPVDVEISGVAADALGATSIGQLAFSALTAARAESVLVGDTDVMAAREFMWEQFRIMLEPSAAVPIAALLSKRFKPEPGSHTAVILCGANTSFEDS